MVSPQDFTGERIILNMDNSFDYYSWSCTWWNKGIGRYTIMKDTLGLIYEVHTKNDTASNSYKIIDDESKKDLNSIDSTISVKFKVTDNTFNSLTGAIIELKNYNRGANVREDGFAIIKNLPKNKSVDFTIKYIDCKKLDINLNTNCNKYIEVILVPKTYWEPKPPGTIEKYIINKKYIENDRVLTSINSNLTLTPIIEKVDD